jgi:hypothetical protein
MVGIPGIPTVILVDVYIWYTVYETVDISTVYIPYMTTSILSIHLKYGRENIYCNIQP